jgi:hypothetical protein
MKKIALILFCLVSTTAWATQGVPAKYCGHLIYNNEGEVWHRGYYLINDEMLAHVDQAPEFPVNSASLQKQEALIGSLEKALKAQRENVGTCITGTLTNYAAGGITEDTLFLTKITKVESFEE